MNKSIKIIVYFCLFYCSRGPVQEICNLSARIVSNQYTVGFVFFASTFFFSIYESAFSPVIDNIHSYGLHWTLFSEELFNFKINTYSLCIYCTYVCMYVFDIVYVSYTYLLAYISFIFPPEKWHEGPTQFNPYSQVNLGLPTQHT